MAKSFSQFVCNICGATSPKWLGKCPECQTWNSLVEELKRISPKTLNKLQNNSAQPITNFFSEKEFRLNTDFEELNRVLGGGFVLGSLVLIGGDPGIGKSTLMLQVASGLSNKGNKILYCSGEESAKQIRMRADRIGRLSENLLLLTTNEIESIIYSATSIKPALVVVDSIQTVSFEKLESSPGTISQIRECTNRLMKFTKSTDIPAVIVGHVTKEGSIAGPKALEHIVDTVLYFEGNSHQTFKILRSVKNRFGSTNEIGIFEMHESGLSEVSNPSEIFLNNRVESSGSVIACSLEGTRPVLIEIQALVSQTNYGYPQRNSTGVDPKRLSMILAVLEKRLGYKLGSQDVFLNLAGGIKISEPAIDLGIAVSIASSYRDFVVRKSDIALGEVGLNGEIRVISQIEKRIGEAEKLGFKRAIIPDKTNLKGFSPKSIQIVRVSGIGNALKEMLVS